MLRLGGARVLLTGAGPGEDPLRENLGLHVGDDPDLVRARRAALAHDLGRPLVWMRQTHSTEVVVLRRPDGGSRDGNTPTREQGDVPADGVVVDARGWSDAPGAAVMVADCLPVLLADDSGQVVAAVHAGRAGLEGGILTRAVSVMAELVGGPSTLHALIGPSICGRCYEVPAEMRERVSAGHPASWSTTSWGTPALDLPAGAEQELLGLGLAEVRRDGRCTREDRLLHSYRRDPRCGREAGVVVPGSEAPVEGCRNGDGRVPHDMPDEFGQACRDLH